MLLLSRSKCCPTAGATLTKSHHSENVQKSERFWRRPFEVSRFPFSLTSHTYKNSQGTSSLPGFRFSKAAFTQTNTNKFLLPEYKLSYEPGRNRQHFTSIFAVQNNEDCKRTIIQSWLLHMETTIFLSAVISDSPTYIYNNTK